jgi:hypothetical protein
MLHHLQFLLLLSKLLQKLFIAAFACGTLRPWVLPEQKQKSSYINLQIVVS